MPLPELRDVMELAFRISIELTPLMFAVAISGIASFIYRRFRDAIDSTSKQDSSVVMQNEYQRRVFDELANREATIEILQTVAKLKNEDLEPDYVVGIGDDGELIYASEKPKRKNDEVDE